MPDNNLVLISGLCIAARQSVGLAVFAQLVAIELAESELVR